jgi:hypothetical protein
MTRAVSRLSGDTLLSKKRTDCTTSRNTHVINVTTRCRVALQFRIQTTNVIDVRISRVSYELKARRCRNLERRRTPSVLQA